MQKKNEKKNNNCEFDTFDTMETERWKAIGTSAGVTSMKTA